MFSGRYAGTPIYVLYSLFRSEWLTNPIWAATSSSAPNAVICITASPLSDVRLLFVALAFTVSVRLTVRLSLCASADIDGAYFGTSFPHIFLMTYESCVPSAPTSSFVPRVFGFKVHASSSSLPRKVVVLDGTSYSNDEGSSDELNFASSVESGAHMALAGAGQQGSSANGHGHGGQHSANSGVPVVYDLTSEPAPGARAAAGAAVGNHSSAQGNSSSAATTLETLSTAALMYAGNGGVSNGVEIDANQDQMHYVQNTASDGSNHNRPHNDTSGTVHGQKRATDKVDGDEHSANGATKKQRT
jgi:hypothetical protein